MNYYEHHLGDYAEATSHLSFIEDAAYSRCIRKYYTTERALPADIAAVQRLIGARSKEERVAVESVLKEFFTLQEDGWHNPRCDEEMARYTDKRSKAKRSANTRWNPQPMHSEGNANAMRTHSEGNALQSPVSNHQSPDSKEEVPQPPNALAREVFEHWKRVWSHPNAVFDLKRQKRIEARLRNFTPAQLCDALSGFRHSPWHCGTDPKGDGKVYDGIDTLLRDTAQVEEGLRLLANPPRAPPKPETASERIHRALNGSDNSRVIEHEPERLPRAITR